MPTKRAAKPRADAPPAPPLAVPAASASTEGALVQYLTDRIAVLEGRIVSLESRLALVECRQANRFCDFYPPPAHVPTPFRPEWPTTWCGKATDDYLSDNQK